MRHYTTKENIENYLTIDIQEGFEGQLDNWIESVSQYIENKTQRRFKPEQEDNENVVEDRYYDGDGSAELLIDDVLEIEEVSVGDEMGNDMSEREDYIVYPRIAPHRKLISQNGFSKGYQNIKVSGVFASYAETPKDIEFIATVLVAGIINVELKKIGKKSERIGNYTVTYTDDKQISDFERVEKMLDFYTKLVI